MGLVALEITGENKDLLAKMTQLERRAETLEGKLKGAGKGGADGFGKMATEAGKFALALAGVGSVESVFSKVVDMARKSIEEMRKLQRDALANQMSMDDARGLFLANNRSLARGDAAAPWIRFAEEQAMKVPRLGAPKVLTDLGLARSALAGTSEEDLKDAFSEAIKMAVLNPNTDLSAATQAMVRIRRDKGGTMTQAANFYSAFAEVSGADISKTAKELPKLQALSALGRGDITDTAALHGMLTSVVPDATGEATTTLVTNLLSRVATRDVEMGKHRRMQFASSNSLDRLMEAAERMNAGEFGDKAEAVHEFTRSLGREASSATLAITGIMANLPQLRTTIAAIREGQAKTTSTTDELLAAKDRLNPASDAMKSARESKGKAEESALGNVSGASMAATEEDLKTWGDAMGIGGAWDIGRGARRLYAERYTPSSQYREDEKRRRLIGAVTSRVTSGGRGRLVSGFLPGIGEDSTQEEILAAGALGGAVDTASRLDLMEQNMLKAAGASPEKVVELQGMFEKGLKDAFKQGLSELLMELRQNRTATRQEVD